MEDAGLEGGAGFISLTGIAGTNVGDRVPTERRPVKRLGEGVVRFSGTKVAQNVVGVVNNVLSEEQVGGND